VWLISETRFYQSPEERFERFAIAGRQIPLALDLNLRRALLIDLAPCNTNTEAGGFTDVSRFVYCSFASPTAEAM
jgi:hypothetical protein